MTPGAAGAVQMPGERLSELLQQSADRLSGVEVVSPPRSWSPLKPQLARFVRRCREGGGRPPRFGGVPLCLFGSEWPGFPSRPRMAAPRGRCVGCAAREACGFDAAVPDELLPISAAPFSQRWRDYTAAFDRVTGSGAAAAAGAMLDEIAGLYRGPVSLEPSVLVAKDVDPSLRFVVFPHRVAAGDVARDEYRQQLAGVARLLKKVAGDAAGDASAGLLGALAALPPSPLPVGLDSRRGEWALKTYLRVEDKSPADRQALLDALAGCAPGMRPVGVDDLQMVGLVLDRHGLHTVKAYVAARPSVTGTDEFPAPLAADHPLVTLAGDRALATLDIWCREARRANKWDFNVRDHYLAGAAAEGLVAELTSSASAARLRPLLVAPTYRADVIAVGVRGRIAAFYMELN